MRQTRKVLANFGYQSRKSLGQNFLLDERVLKEIADLAFIKPDEHVVEIGSGPGSLTKYLVKKAQKVFAIEMDAELAQILNNEIMADNLEIIQTDILQFNFNQIKLKEQKLKVVSNLPYNISTEVIFKLLETPGIFSELYLMFQKEVAERIVAEPGTKDYGILSVVAQYHSDPEILLTLGPEVFKPRPKVNSALVKLKILDQPRFEVADYREFKRVIRAGFAMRRKMFKNALAKSGLGLTAEKVEELLAKVGIDLKARAENLSLEQFVRLANLYSEGKKQNA